MNVPTKPGFYWAKWMITDDHVPEEYTPFRTWEPVEVYLHDDGRLRVWLVGHDFNQSVDCFHWGDRLEPPLDKQASFKKQAEEQELIDARARYVRMNFDEREAFLQRVRLQKD